jgi:hypothetical protein
MIHSPSIPATAVTGRRSKWRAPFGLMGGDARAALIEPGPPSSHSRIFIFPIGTLEHGEPQIALGRENDSA